jgi:hypothetical protein
MDLAEADLASSTLDERNAILVERLMNGTHTRLAATEGNTSDDVRGESTFVTRTEPFDNGSPHTEFDPIQRDEPDNVLEKAGLTKNALKRGQDIPRPKQYQSTHQK